MELFNLVIRNLYFHRLRTSLTICGIAVSLFAFVMIRTLIAAWYSGVEATAKNRMVVRNAVSLVFPLPIAYLNTIERVPGIEKVGYGNWFGGIYKDKKFQSAQFAVDPNYLDLYPEYIFVPEEKEAWLKDRKGIIIGEEFSNEFGVNIGDTIQLQGTIFPGLWEFNVRGIFKGRDKITDTRVLYFHWNYLNERNKAEIRRNPDYVGFYLLQISPGVNPSVVGKAVDENFANSFAETLTETETAFVQGFISMSSAIIAGLNTISIVVVLIMLLVLANTMLMSFRERYHEYSILKSIGFQNRKLSLLIFTEAILLCVTSLIIVGLLLIPFLLLPTRVIFGSLAAFFPVFLVTSTTVILLLLLTVGIALISALFPITNLLKLRVSEGLRKLP